MELTGVPLVRVSLQAYNDEADVDALVDALAAFSTDGPGIFPLQPRTGRRSPARRGGCTPERRLPNLRAQWARPSAASRAARSSSATAAATSTPPRATRQGLFYHDTRFLSKWKLTIDGEGLSPLSTDDIHYSFAQFFLVRGTGTVYTDSSISVLRQRFVGDGFHEDLTVDEPRPRAGRARGAHRGGRRLRRPLRGQGRDGEEGRRATQHVEGDAHRPALHARALRPRDLDQRDRARGRARRGRRHLPHPDRARTAAGARASTSSRPSSDAAEPTRASPLPARRVARRSPKAPRAWRNGSRARPRSSPSWRPLEEVYARSLVDLAALRFYPAVLREGQAVPAAGLPWFMALFGRDSLITSYQALPLRPRARRRRRCASLALFQATGRRRVPRRRAREDPARAPLRRADRLRGAAALAVLRLGRLDAALPHRARRVRALDGRRRARAALRARGARRPRVDRPVRRPRRRRLRRVPAAQHRRPGSTTSAGRTRTPRSSTGTARSPRRRAPSARSRATSTTPSCAARGSRARSGATRSWPRGWSRRRRS